MPLISPWPVWGKCKTACTSSKRIECVEKMAVEVFLVHPSLFERRQSHGFGCKYLIIHREMFDLHGPKCIFDLISTSSSFLFKKIVCYTTYHDVGFNSKRLASFFKKNSMQGQELYSLCKVNTHIVVSHINLICLFLMYNYI
jgi:hypothetical protein